MSVKVKRADGSVGTVREDVWRTDQGYVVDSPATLMPWGLASVWALRDANAEHLRDTDGRMLGYAVEAWAGGRTPLLWLAVGLAVVGAVRSGGGRGRG